MSSLAYRFFYGTDLIKAFEELGEKLSKTDYTAEQAFCYECACRLTQNEDKIKELKNNILKANEAYCENSYDMFNVYNKPIEHEFDIRMHDKPYKDVVTLADRYFAILHNILTMDENDLKELKECVSFIEYMKKDLVLAVQTCETDFIKNQVNYLMNLFLKKAGSHLASMSNDLPIMLLALKCGVQDENICMKIIEKYLENDDIKTAIDFYNEKYASIYKKRFCQSELDLFHAVIDYEYELKNYSKALRFEALKAKCILNKGI